MCHLNKFHIDYITYLIKESYLGNHNLITLIIVLIFSCIHVRFMFYVSAIIGTLLLLKNTPHFTFILFTTKKKDSFFVLFLCIYLDFLLGFFFFFF
jgi:hypothetical protein